MAGLKSQIKQLEAEINLEKKRLSQNKSLLKERMASPKFLTCAVLGGFALGYIIERHKLKDKIRGVLRTAPKMLKGFNAAMSILSPSLFIKL